MNYKEFIKPRSRAGRKSGEELGTPKYTPEEFESLVYGYVDECFEDRKIPAKQYFALLINISREQLYKFYGVNENYKDAYDVLDTACAGMVEDIAQNPREGDIRHAGILAFSLKAQAGWRDKQEIEHSEKVVDSGEDEW